jgi:hypothetical protein
MRQKLSFQLNFSLCTYRLLLGCCLGLALPERYLDLSAQPPAQLEVEVEVEAEAQYCSWL